MPERYREHCLPCSTQSGRSAPKLFSQERTVCVVIAPCLPHLLLSSGVCSLGMHENLLPEHSDCRRLWIPGARALIHGAQTSHGRGARRSVGRVKRFAVRAELGGARIDNKKKTEI